MKNPESTTNFSQAVARALSDSKLNKMSTLVYCYLATYDYQDKYIGGFKEKVYPSRLTCCKDLQMFTANFDDAIKQLVEFKLIEKLSHGVENGCDMAKEKYAKTNVYKFLSQDEWESDDKNLVGKIRRDEIVKMRKDKDLTPLGLKVFIMTKCYGGILIWDQFKPLLRYKYKEKYFICGALKEAEKYLGTEFITISIAKKNFNLSDFCSYINKIKED